MPVVSGWVQAYITGSSVRMSEYLNTGLTPVRVLIVFPTKSITDFRFQIPKKACAFSDDIHRNLYRYEDTPCMLLFQSGRPRLTYSGWRILILASRHPQCLWGNTQWEAVMRKDLLHTCFQRFAFYNAMTEVYLIERMYDWNEILLKEGIQYIPWRTEVPLA